MNPTSVVLEYSSRSPEAAALETKLKQMVVGQDEAIEKIVDVYETFKAGLSPVGRPIGNLIFLGPTGTGKTRVVEALAEALFLDINAALKVDCAEFQHSHEIARLLGSPPGYLGHRETSPTFTNERLKQYHTEKNPFSIVLFDEIEKASDALWKLMLGIMDKGTLTLGDNRVVDFSNTIIFMTSNVGANEMERLVEGGYGFTPAQASSETNQKEIATTAIDAMKRKFSPEFVNRLDKIVVFNSIEQKQLEVILDIELGRVQQRVLQAKTHNQFVFTLDNSVRKLLLKEGFDKKYGARHLKRAIERHLIGPFSSMVSSGAIRLGDFIKVSLGKNGKLVFTREAENALVPALLREGYGYNY